MNIITIFEEVASYIYIFCIKNLDGVFFRGSSENFSFLAWEKKWGEWLKRITSLHLIKRQNVLIFELYIKYWEWGVEGWLGCSNKMKRIVQQKKTHTKIKSTQQGWMIPNLILKIYYFSAFNDGTLNFNENIQKDKLKNIIMIKYFIKFLEIIIISLLVFSYW